MAVIYERTKEGKFRVSREFTTLAAAASGAAALESVSESAFEPVKPVEGHVACQSGEVVE